MSPLPVLIFGDHTRIFKFVDFPFVAGADGIKVIIPDDSKFNHKFLYYALSHTKIKNLGYKRHYPILKEQLLPLPPLPEQQKIAEILSTADEAIQQISEIIAKTQELKKGLMQELLTKGIGHTRFKKTEIGEIPEEWEVVKLGDESNRVVELIMGQSPPSSTYNEENNGLLFLQGNADFGEIYPEPKIYTSQPIKIAEKNDVLISVRAPVGELNLAPYKCCIGRGLAAIRPDQTKLDYRFIFYYFKQSTCRLLAMATGSTFGAIRKEDLVSFLIPLPPLPEQQKIAEILSCVDEKIEVERKKKAELEELKKGLMQDLLTGRVRVISRQ